MNRLLVVTSSSQVRLLRESGLSDGWDVATYDSVIGQRYDRIVVLTLPVGEKQAQALLHMRTWLLPKGTLTVL